MNGLNDLSFTWVPGTMDRVRFTYAGRTHIVYLRDVIRHDVHSDSALYLKGRVILPVSARHLVDLMGRFSLGSSRETGERKHQV
ncbi:hypothetical protein [Deinococcus radiotolerans]|uniref:HTH LytTR-type domain-containing protein n=1 Tax=Deinococcus radiotolerans TaxID=1309407 RepID=A0ABQ2FRU9_9DEIO|nr:hypothetical protein [Deinococcus radiotolerans]GGL20354.1 hypothetical protein GCM10010844_44030 [Deinococcus radiotolerans]